MGREALLRVHCMIKLHPAPIKGGGVSPPVTTGDKGAGAGSQRL